MEEAVVRLCQADLSGEAWILLGQLWRALQLSVPDCQDVVLLLPDVYEELCAKADQLAGLGEKRRGRRQRVQAEPDEDDEEQQEQQQQWPSDEEEWQSGDDTEEEEQEEAEAGTDGGGDEQEDAGGADQERRQGPVTRGCSRRQGAGSVPAEQSLKLDQALAAANGGQGVTWLLPDPKKPDDWPHKPPPVIVFLIATQPKAGPAEEEEPDAPHLSLLLLLDGPRVGYTALRQLPAQPALRQFLQQHPDAQQAAQLVYLDPHGQSSECCLAHKPGNTCRLEFQGIRDVQYLFAPVLAYLQSRIRQAARTGGRGRPSRLSSLDLMNNHHIDLLTWRLPPLSPRCRSSSLACACHASCLTTLHWLLAFPLDKQLKGKRVAFSSWSTGYISALQMELATLGHFLLPNLQDLQKRQEQHLPATLLAAGWFGVQLDRAQQELVYPGPAGHISILSSLCEERWRVQLMAACGPPEASVQLLKPLAQQMATCRVARPFHLLTRLHTSDPAAAGSSSQAALAAAAAVEAEEARPAALQRWLMALCEPSSSSRTAAALFPAWGDPRQKWQQPVVLSVKKLNSLLGRQKLATAVKQQLVHRPVAAAELWDAAGKAAIVEAAEKRAEVARAAAAAAQEAAAAEAEAAAAAILQAAEAEAAAAAQAAAAVETEAAADAAGHSAGMAAPPVVPTRKRHLQAPQGQQQGQQRGQQNNAPQQCHHQQQQQVASVTGSHVAAAAAANALTGSSRAAASRTLAPGRAAGALPSTTWTPENLLQPQVQPPQQRKQKKQKKHDTPTRKDRCRAAATAAAGRLSGSQESRQGTGPAAAGSAPSSEQQQPSDGPFGYTQQHGGTFQTRQRPRTGTAAAAAVSPTATHGREQLQYRRKTVTDLRKPQEQACGNSSS